MIGKTISHYRIIEKLGEGGMGVVYKAEDTKLKRTVALKFLPPESMRDAQAKARFFREAQAAAALSHPNVCTVYEVDEADGHTFIAMDLVEGGSLRDRIARGPLALGEALELAVQVAEGLSAAHEGDVVHRDIKPGNILMTKRGRAEIVDFGLAKLAQEPRLTKVGSTTGTVAYMSPEQAAGSDVDHRTDIWALGVVLYEMVTGRRPFRGDQDHAVVRSILDDQPEPLTALRTGVPLELERIVGKCLYKEPGERYQTVADLLADLHHLQRELREDLPQGRTTVLPTPARRPARRWPWVVLLVAVVGVAGWISIEHLAPSEPTSSPGRKMLVVLPFENLGDAEDEYFADGITEEITARLASFKGLGVIARTSAVKYRGQNKTIRQIGQELGVDYVLEGTVRWQRGTGAENQVRVTPRLIRVEDESHVWADIYQEDAGDIFRVQSGIAEKVAGVMDIELLEPERLSLETRPTQSLEAYQAYLRGMEREPLGYGYEDVVLMEEMFTRATDLDPDFALAHAVLSRTHSRFYIFHHDRSEERLSKARAAADRALELMPDLPEGHLALGQYYYTGSRDYQRALAELEIAERARPNDTDVLFLKGVIYKRQARFEEALEVHTRAARLDPLDAELADEISIIYRFLTKYVEAERYCDRAIALAPDKIEGYAQKAHLYRIWRGDLGMARDVLMQMPPTRTDEWSAEWYKQEYFERNFQAALDWLEQRRKKPAGHLVTVAWLHHLMGDGERALALYDSARASLEIRVAAHPEDPYIRRTLANAYSGLGRKEDAIREIELAMETPELIGDIPTRRDAIEQLAAIYAEQGELDAAVEKLQYLLSVRSHITGPLLRLDPSWDPLRGHPGFERLLEEYSDTEP